MTRALYIIGPPGSGKSTLMQLALSHWNQVGPAVRLTPKEMFGQYLDRPGETGLYLGKMRDQFPGTDALSMSVNPVAIGWLYEGNLPDVILGEGTRLANRPFLRALAATTQLTIIHLTGDPDVLYQRGLDRPDDGDWKPVSRKMPDGHWKRFQRKAGTPQSPQYLRSRFGACNRIASEMGALTLDTTHLTADAVGDQLCALIP